MELTLRNWTNMFSVYKQDDFEFILQNIPGFLLSQDHFGSEIKIKHEVLENKTKNHWNDESSNPWAWKGFGIL